MRSTLFLLSFLVTADCLCKSSGKTLGAARLGVMPRRLPDELLEEVLRRLPPHEPADLVRAALVSTRWCHLASDPGFRRRFREFHGNPPMLGLLCNQIECDGYKINNVVRFIPTTTAFPSPQKDFRGMRVLDARHGRVLCEKGEGILAVWDPITDEVQEFHFPKEGRAPWTAAVLCTSAAGACDHLDCHHGSFLVAYVCFSSRHGTTVVHTYSSDAAAWSEPVCAPQPCVVVAGNAHPSSALVGNALYFVKQGARTALKYDLELHQVSLIQLPYLSERWSLHSMLTTTEDGQLWFVTEDYSKLYMWSAKDTHDVDAKWERRVIELKTVLPVDSVITKFSVIGSGVGNIFIKTGDEIYRIDLKTYKVKKVYEAHPTLFFRT